MHEKLIFSTHIQLVNAILAGGICDIRLSVYGIYVLCLSLVVLHVNCKDQMPLKQLEQLQCRFFSLTIQIHCATLLRVVCLFCLQKQCCQQTLFMYAYFRHSR